MESNRIGGRDRKSGPAVLFHDGARTACPPRAPAPLSGPMLTSRLESAAIHVRLFARYAGLLGAGSGARPGEGGPPGGAVLPRIRALPGGSDIGAGALVAVTLRQARPDQPVSPGDEVALLPPLAGG